MVMKLDPAVMEKYPGFHSAYAFVSGVTVETEVEPLNERISGFIGELAPRLRAGLDQIPEVRAFRETFAKMGRDPSVFRPHIENLLQSVAEGRFPKVNNVLDSCALASLEGMVSVRPYDVLKITGDVVTTLAGPSEKPLELEGGGREAPLPGEIVLRDSGKLLSAYTLGDSKAAKISFGTSSVLIVIWGAPGIPEDNVRRALDAVCLYARKYCGGHVDRKEIL